MTPISRPVAAWKLKIAKLEMRFLENFPMQYMVKSFGYWSIGVRVDRVISVEAIMRRSLLRIGILALPFGRSRCYEMGYGDL